MLQTSLGARITVAGDDESTVLRLDLRKHPVQLIGSGYGLLPAIPDSILSLSIGGPGISVQREQKIVSDATLIGPLLVLEFSVALLCDPEHYTIEIIFGYNGVDARTALTEVIGQRPETE